MTGIQVVSLIISIAFMAIMLELVRRRQLKEKYAVLWTAIGAVMVVLSAWPALLNWSARRLGVLSGPNLLLLLGLIVVLGVCVHLSWEVSRLEDKTRLLAEEIALLRLDRESRHSDRAGDR